MCTSHARTCVMCTTLSVLLLPLLQLISRRCVHDVHDVCLGDKTKKTGTSGVRWGYGEEETKKKKTRQRIYNKTAPFYSLFTSARLSQSARERAHYTPDNWSSHLACIDRSHTFRSSTSWNTTTYSKYKGEFILWFFFFYLNFRPFSVARFLHTTFSTTTVFRTMRNSTHVRRAWQRTDSSRSD